MPAVQYPFIDIAVHPRIRDRFARGEAMALFSVGLDRVLWANGAGADLFGYAAIYDFLDQGARPGDVSFRQISATAHQLHAVGETRGFLIRVASGFQRIVANASVEMIRTPAGEDAILFSCPISAKPLETNERAQRMLDGFDDPDTHIAVIGRDGEIIAASPGFRALGITTETAGMLVTMAGTQPERLIKRPIRTGQGFLPAAIGRLSDTPALNLLFVVEMVIGHLDPVETAPAALAVQAPASDVITPAAVELVSGAVAPEAHAVVDEHPADAGTEGLALESAERPKATEAEEAKPLADETVGSEIAANEAVDKLSGEAPVQAAADSQQEADALLCEPERDDVSPTPAIEETASEAPAPEEPGFAAAIDAVAEIEDVEEAPEEIADIEAAPDVVDSEAEHQPAEVGEHIPDGDSDVAAGGGDHPSEPTDPAGPAIEHVISEPVAEGDETSATSDILVDKAGVAEQPGSEEARIAADDAATAVLMTDADTEDHAGDEPAAVEATSEPVEAAAAVSGTEQDAAGDVVATPEQPQPFVFNRHGRATRFVWKIDAEGRFSEISREFAEAVGPHAKAITGVAFVDIAALFNLDPDGKIAELLARRDTWSGRTIHWPVEGTTLTVPVDLAALPTYTRNREFDGFRGFGVVRLSDAAEDPRETGLTLGDRPAVDGEPEDLAEVVPTTSESEDRQEEALVVDQATAEEDLSGSDAVAPSEEHVTAPSQGQTEQIFEPNEPELPFHVERPALQIAETPNRRLSDKVIQLHERRLTVSEGLSLAEQAAFREIAKQLEPFGKRGEPPEQTTEDAVQDPGAQTETPEGEPTASTLPPAAANDDKEGAASLEHAGADESTDLPETDFNALDVLNTAIPPRVKMTDGLSASIVDQLPVAILIHAGDTLIHANSEFMRLTGYASLEEVEGVGGLDALLQRQDLEDKTERSGVMVVVRADDVLVPVTARLQSIRWEDTSALMLALMPVDKDGDALVTARSDSRDEARPERMLEKVAKLQVEVEELQSILETATDGVAIIGPEGDIRSMNRSASALFNYDEQETRGKPFVMLFAHESQKAVLDYLSGLTGNGVASVLNDGREVIGREASGGFVPLFMTMGVLTSSNGYCAVIRDITQWKRTEEELRNAKRAAETANAHKSDFLARVSHEIRTPLNAIIGFSDMMASERLGPMGHARYVEYAGDIGRSGRHVLDIVNDLLDISKIEAGEMELEFGAVGLNEAIAEAVSIVQPQANGQRVIIRTGLSQSVPNVVADLRSIKQIALNILSNAIRFTPSGGQIVVSTSYEGNGSVVLRIRDTGIGMTRTELEQAMKPFRQVATNARQRGDGTGLGLPLTKAMVDANRALFAIHSAPNEGTLVEVTFPSPRVLAD